MYDIMAKNFASPRNIFFYYINLNCCSLPGPRTAQGLIKAALEAAQSAVNQRLSGGGQSSRGGKVNESLPTV